MKKVALVLGFLALISQTAFAHEGQCLLSADYQIDAELCESGRGMQGELLICGTVDKVQGKLAFKKSSSGEIRSWNEGTTPQRNENYRLIVNQYGTRSGAAPYLNIEVLSIRGQAIKSGNSPEIKVGIYGLQPSFSLDMPATSGAYQASLVLSNPVYGPCEFPAE